MTRGQSVLRWLQLRDAGLSATRRAARAAIIMPGLFALCATVLDNPTMATFAAFGSVGMLLFVDFGGSLRERVLAQSSLVLGGAALVCLGTLASHAVWLAALGMFVVGLVVLFVGVVSSVLASAATTLLVSFILPVSLPGAVSSLPDRLAGWLLAGGASVLAIRLLWPAPTREPLRAAAARACGLLAQRLRAEVDCVDDGFAADRVAAAAGLADEATAAVTALRTAFFATPYRPTGLTTAARTLVRLVDQVVWLDTVLQRMPIDQQAASTSAAICEVKLTAAALLERGAALLESAAGDLADLERDVQRLREARETMEQTVTSGLPSAGAGADPESAAAAFVSSLEPSFRAQEMGFVTLAMVENIRLTIAARRRTWWQHLMGTRPGTVASPLSSARERAAAHLEPHSVWLHNSVRGAIALSLAVLVSQLTGVQHSFWVVFGTLAVLRTNALSTGQNALRGSLGTVAGIVIGGAIILAIGTNTTVSWVLLPIAVAFTGLAPAAISFAAGQAGFTMTLLILYNIISPTGWEIGLVRLEDVALGCAVSVVVGAIFWPRGAGPALNRALGDALAESAQYLRSAIEYGVSRCDALVPDVLTPQEERRRAAAASRRLDDAFRSFLSERGAKPVTLADVTTLINGVAALRLSADAVLDLWERDDGSATGDRAAARSELRAVGAPLVDWFQQTARALARGGPVPTPLEHDPAADGRLVDAVRRDLVATDGRGATTAVKMIWTADHLDAARRLQVGLFLPAGASAAMQPPERPWPSQWRLPSRGRVRASEA